MVSGQETLFVFSLSNQDGFTLLPTLFNFTTLCQDFKENSLATSLAGLMAMTLLLTTGFMKDQIANPLGIYLKDFGDG